jgi:acetate kinase
VLILCLNAGSSSLKFNLMDMRTEASLADGIAERIGISEGFIRWSIRGEKGRLDLDMKDHKVALKAILDQLHQTVLADGQDVVAVGHRVAHGGPRFKGSVLVTPDFLHEIEELSFFAPLHNPANAQGIRTAMEMFPNVPQVAVFDTAFHQTMPDHAYTYGLPYDLCQELGLRRYGFHGTSHNYVAQRTAALLGRPIEALKIITCHLGNGSSITAIKHGQSIDTSMGLTPLEGVIMGSRCGNVDPGVLTTIMEKKNLDAKGLSALLNKQSGLLGISGLSSDCRESEDTYTTRDRSRLALDVLSYGVLKYVGAYTAAMDGVDAITFTAGIGENGPIIREWVCRHLTYLGVDLDEGINNTRRKDERLISTPASRVAVCVIPTNEELMIARDTLALATQAVAVV